MGEREGYKESTDYLGAVDHLEIAVCILNSFTVIAVVAAIRAFR
ncbi:MAG: hypothetical protein ABSD38_02470 [Syntrophorhabdales bacterium]